MTRQIDVEPALVDQIRQDPEGEWMIVPAEAGTVAGDLKKIDAGLKVRFSKQGKCWIVSHHHHAGCPHNGEGGPGSSYLVSTVKAHQSPVTGIWMGLDQRIVERFRQIDPQGRGHYDYAAELERHNRKVAEDRKARVREEMEEMAEGAAHALRKDFGAPYKGRIFLPRELAA